MVILVLMPLHAERALMLSKLPVIDIIQDVTYIFLLDRIVVPG